MQHKKLGDKYLIRLERGEKVMESIRTFAEGLEIQSGAILGLGAVEESELGFYDLKSKSYIRKQLPEEMELTNLTGNLSWFENKIHPHCHVTLADREFRAWSGHLFECKTAVTVELSLFPYPEKITRSPVPEIGLNLLDL